MRSLFARSLSLRLLLTFAITAFLLVALLVALFTQGLSSQWQRSIRPHLVQYVRYVQEDLGVPPAPERARDLADSLPVTISIFDGDRFVYSTDGQRPEIENLRFHSVPGRVQHQLAERDDRRAPSMRASITHERGHEGTLLRIDSGSDTVYYRFRETSERRRRDGNGLYLALFATLVVLAGSYLFIRRQLAPIRQIQHSVRQISDGDLTQRIDPGGRDDLADLARSIDDMSARIAAMLDAKRQLLLAISHELRSPLARARVATELLPEGRQRDRLETDLAEMSRLIADLTESERLRTPHATLHREPLDLAALVADELAPYGIEPAIVDKTIDGRSDKDTAGIAGHDACATNFSLHADATRLRVLVRNLVGNAFRHGKDANGQADVTVSLTARTDAIILAVMDRGPGIPVDQLERVTEPFYRPDAARTRAGGGIGLGLSLARLIAEAHGGTLRLDSDPAREPGTRATVTLPRQPAKTTASGVAKP